MELCAIRLERVKVVGASSTVAITGHVIALTNESCLDRENGETWESIHAPKSDDTGTPMVPFLNAADVSIVFIGKHDFWNKIISVNTESNRPRILEPYRRVFGIDFNNIILWLQYLKVFSFKYHDCVINETMTNKVALEKNVDIYRY